MTAPKDISDNYKQILPGVYELVPNEIYHASEGLSSSNIKDISESIKHYLMRSKTKPTDAMIKGSALHDLVLLPEVYDETYLVSSTMGKDTKVTKQLKEEYPDKVVLSGRDAEDIRRMRDSLYQNPAMREILGNQDTLREVSIWGVDTGTGLIIKCRPDLICDGVIYDIKTTISPIPRGFLQAIYKFKYHVSDMFYRHVCWLNGMTITDFRYLVVGNKPPYLTGIYRINSDLLAEGEDIYRQSLITYSNYLSSDDKWDGLAQGREVVTL